MDKECKVCEYVKEPITTYFDDEDMFVGTWHNGRDCVILKDHSKHFKNRILNKIKKKIDEHIGIGKTLVPDRIDDHIIIFII